ncbi:MAG: hypothetical protein WBX25_13450 [Rhodomicrobium sp.]
MGPKDNRKDYFLKKAWEAREGAKTTDDAWLKEMLEEVAAHYEALALEASEFGVKKDAVKDAEAEGLH